MNPYERATLIEILSWHTQQNKSVYEKMSDEKLEYEYQTRVEGAKY
jgi:hypothetical protein